MNQHERSFIFIAVTAGYMVLFLLTSMTCGDRDAAPVTAGGDPEAFRHLEIRFLHGMILYRIDPLLPLHLRLTVELAFAVHNSDAGRAFSGLRIPYGDLHHSFTGSPLGQIAFTTTWDGYLAPLRTDTVILHNDSLRQSWIESRCGEFVFLTCRLQDATRNTKTIVSDSLRYDCIP